MPQIFHPSFNAVARGTIFGAWFAVAAGLYAGARLYRSAYATGEGLPVEQPVPFSHKHHVGGLGIDCRYCHEGVERAAEAGLPPTKTCMNCHSQIWSESPALEPVRRSWRTGERLRWARVHDLADFAYFDHSVHLAGGIGCSTCHGDVRQMPLTWKTQSLLMTWCLDCHRNPDPHRRPPERLFDADAEPGSTAAGRGGPASTDCGACHR